MRLRSVRYESDSGSWRPGTTASSSVLWRLTLGMLVLGSSPSSSCSLFAGADLPVGSGEQEGDAEADGGTGEPAECGAADAGAWCAESAFFDGDGLGAFEGGEHELRRSRPGGC